jgi:hypothetical protein
MDTTKRKGAKGIAYTLTGVILAAPIPHLDSDFEHPLHTPHAAFANLAVSTSVASLASGSALEWTAFRAQLAQPVEILADEVSDYILRAPVTLVMRPSSHVACTREEPCVNPDDGDEDQHRHHEERLPAEYSLEAESGSYWVNEPSGIRA